MKIKLFEEYSKEKFFKSFFTKEFLNFLENKIIEDIDVIEEYKEFDIDGKYPENENLIYFAKGNIYIEQEKNLYNKDRDVDEPLFKITKVNCQIEEAGIFDEKGNDYLLNAEQIEKLERNIENYYRNG